MRLMELIDDLKKRRETISLLDALQEARIETLRRVKSELEKAPATQDGFLLSDIGVSLLHSFEQLSLHIDEGVDILCALNEKIGLPVFHLRKEFKELVEQDKALVAKFNAKRPS
jgi:hypothetical protein